MLDNSILLVVGTVVAVTWANLDTTGYEHATHPLHFWVNDVGMVFFFALAAKEVFEATLPGGPLASLRQAASPLAAAVGGMVAPAADLRRARDTAWPRIAGAWLGNPVCDGHRVLGDGRPDDLLRGASCDSLSAAVGDRRRRPGVDHPGDVLPVRIALIRLARPADERRAAARVVAAPPAHRELLALRAGSGSAVVGRAVCGRVSSGTGAGARRPFHAPLRAGLRTVRPAEEAQADTLSRFEHWWARPVQFVLLLFGLTNAGVPFEQIGNGTYYVLAALLLGKPLGIVVFSYAARLASARLPDGLVLADVVVVGIAAAIGFTVALFFATAAFPAGPLLAETKMGALLSFGAAPMALLASRMLRRRQR